MVGGFTQQFFYSIAYDFMFLVLKVRRWDKNSLVLERRGDSSVLLPRRFRFDFADLSHRGLKIHTLDTKSLYIVRKYPSSATRGREPFFLPDKQPNSL